jgi:hypothetical protein
MAVANHKQKQPATNIEDQPRATCDSSSFVSKAAEKAKDAASFVGEKAEQATEAVGAGMESLGGAIREHEPNQGTVHNAGEAMASKLEGAGRYLEEHGLKGIGEDVTNLIRRNPVPALLLGIGVGFLLSRMVRS